MIKSPEFFKSSSANKEEETREEELPKTDEQLAEQAVAEVEKGIEEETGDENNMVQTVRQDVRDYITSDEWEIEIKNEEVLDEMLDSVGRIIAISAELREQAEELRKIYEAQPDIEERIAKLEEEMADASHTKRM